MRVLLLIAAAWAAPAAAAEGEVPVRLETVADGLLQPVSLAFSPDGDLFVSEKQTGRVRLVRRATSAHPAAARTAATLGPVDPRSERGLLGLAVHPRWAQGKRLLFAYYTTDAGERAVQRVVALEFDETLRPRGAPRTILDGLPAGPPGGLNHDGGAIALREESGRTLLYVFVGDNALGQRAPIWPHPSQEVLWRDGGKVDATTFPATGGCPQRRLSLHGKVLRVLDDGGMPGDNPALAGVSGDRTDGRCSPIFALGLRNGYGLGFHPLTGDLWVTDNGNELDDEVDRIEAGGNYGWPCMHGRKPNRDDGDFWTPSRGACARLSDAGAFHPPDFVDPGRPVGDNTPGYAGLAFVTRCLSYGPDGVGNLVWASADGRLFRARLRAPAYRELVSVDTSWVTLRFPVDVRTGPDGLLYVADLSGAIYRIVPARPVPAEACAGSAPAPQQEKTQR